MTVCGAYMYCTRGHVRQHLFARPSAPSATIHKSDRDQRFVPGQGYMSLNRSRMYCIWRCVYTRNIYCRVCLEDTCVSTSLHVRYLVPDQGYETLSCQWRGGPNWTPRGPGKVLGPYGRAYEPIRHLRDRLRARRRRHETRG